MIFTVREIQPQGYFIICDSFQIPCVDQRGVRQSIGSLCKDIPLPGSLSSAIFETPATKAAVLDIDHTLDLKRCARYDGTVVKIRKLDNRMRVCGAAFPFWSKEWSARQIVGFEPVAPRAGPQPTKC